MVDPDEAARIDYIAGEVHGLLAFALAAARTHPNRALLAKHFAAARQVGLAKLETQLALDELVEGFQHVCDEIETKLRPAAEGQGSPDIPV